MARQQKTANVVRALAIHNSTFLKAWCPRRWTKTNHAMRIEVMRGHTKSLDANHKLIQTRSHVRNAIASRERQVVMRKVKSTIVASRRVAQRDRWIVTLFHKHFDLGKTRCATTDYVTWKATVDVCNRIDYAAHDWHRLVDKLVIFIQRWYACFCSAKSLVFHRCKIFVAGLVYVVSI